MQQPPLQSSYYAWPQPQPPSRRKRNSIIWWIYGVIACVLLAIIIIVSYVLTGHSLSFGGCSLSSSAGNSAPHATLASTYSGALAWGASTLPMSLNSVNENQQGAICGTLVLGTVANNSHPFTGTVTENNITFTATLAGMTVPSTFTGIIDNASIDGGCTTQDGSYCGTWAISPG